MERDRYGEDKAKTTPKVFKHTFTIIISPSLV